MTDLKQIVAALHKLGERVQPVFRLIHGFLAGAVARIKPLVLSAKSFIVKTGIRKTLIYLAILCLVISAIWMKHIYTIYYSPNVVKNYLLYIHDGDNYGQVEKLLQDNGCLSDVKTFRSLANTKDYKVNIKPGAYKLQQGWSNNKLINLLRSGAQTPVMVTFNNVRTREELAGKLAHQLQSDSATFLSSLKNDSNAIQFGFNPETFPSLFIPNTYSFFWTTTPEGFLTRMKHEYELFWNETRKLKAKTIGLTTVQVATLASIIQEESNKNDERPIIAGVYLNRLKKSWPLQADPTIRFALGDFTIRRILTAQLSIDSPYNTYKNAGLPPGPINFPEIACLEAVLNASVHDFFYFCAREDFSGYHNFSKTLAEHNKNAQKYQAALNKKKIYK